MRNKAIPFMGPARRLAGALLGIAACTGATLPAAYPAGAARAALPHPALVAFSDSRLLPSDAVLLAQMPAARRLLCPAGGPRPLAVPSLADAIAHADAFLLHTYGAAALAAVRTGPPSHGAEGAERASAAAVIAGAKDGIGKYLKTNALTNGIVLPHRVPCIGACQFEWRKPPQILLPGTGFVQIFGHYGRIIKIGALAVLKVKVPGTEDYYFFAWQAPQQPGLVLYVVEKAPDHEHGDPPSLEGVLKSIVAGTQYYLAFRDRAPDSEQWDGEFPAKPEGATTLKPDLPFGMRIVQEINWRIAGRVLLVVSDLDAAWAVDCSRMNPSDGCHLLTDDEFNAEIGARINDAYGYAISMHGTHVNFVLNDCKVEGCTREMIEILNNPVSIYMPSGEIARKTRMVESLADYYKNKHDLDKLRRLAK